MVGMSSDPVAYGIVTSLSTDRKATSLALFIDAGAELWGKRLELLKENRSCDNEGLPGRSQGILRDRRIPSGSGNRFAAGRSDSIGASLLRPAHDAEYRHAFEQAVAMGRGCSDCKHFFHEKYSQTHAHSSRLARRNSPADHLPRPESSLLVGGLNGV